MNHLTHLETHTVRTVLHAWTHNFIVTGRDDEQIEELPPARTLHAQGHTRLHHSRSPAATFFRNLAIVPTEPWFFGTLLEELVQGTTPPRPRCHLRLELLKRLPVNLTSSAVDIDFAELEPSFALPKVPNAVSTLSDRRNSTWAHFSDLHVEQDDDEECKVRQEKVVGAERLDGRVELELSASKLIRGPAVRST